MEHIPKIDVLKSAGCAVEICKSGNIVNVYPNCKNFHDYWDKYENDDYNNLKFSGTLIVNCDFKYYYDNNTVEISNCHTKYNCYNNNLSKKYKSLDALRKDFPYVPYLTGADRRLFRPNEIYYYTLRKLVKSVTESNLIILNNVSKVSFRRPIQERKNHDALD